ncbi:MAG TPA: DUF3313 family protein [Caulobacteraceae bacterium]|jgi:hypothetical protein
MDRRMFLGVGVTSLAALAPLATARAELPKSWDGLVLIKSKKLEAVYLAPGADFAPYTKVRLGPTSVAFQKDWRENYNTQADFDHQLSEDQAQRIMTEVRKGFESIFAKTFTKAGYAVVDTPAKDVLQLNSAVVNLALTAPDVQAPEMSANFSGTAGQATMILEARDSLTGALLGRALDAEVAGNFWEMRNSVTNTAAFTQVGDQWAEASVKGLEKLRNNASLVPPAPKAAAAASAAKPASATAGP